jgi:uncharacterized delta-60 repeat protein
MKFLFSIFRIYPLLLFLILGLSLSQAQTFSRSWIKTFGNDSVPGNFKVEKLCIDNNQNVYTVSNKDSSNEWEVISINKYNPAGQHLWTRIYTNSPGDNSTAVTIVCDPNNNIYIGGYEFNPNQEDDFLVLKYDSAGNLQWKYNYNGVGNEKDQIVDMQIDNAGNIYITGTGGLSGSPFYFSDVVCCKLNPSGQLLWETYLNYPLNTNVIDFPLYLNLDAQSNLFISGKIKSSELCKLDSAGNILWFGSAIAITQNINDVVLDDAASIYLAENNSIVKYDSTGTFQWQKSFFAANPGKLNSLGHRNGNLYATGFVDSLSQLRSLTLKITLNGDTVWSSLNTLSPGSNDNGEKIICHKDGDLTILGNSQTVSQQYNLMALRYDSSGTLLWSQQFDDSLHQNDNFIDAAADSSKNIYAGAIAFLFNNSYCALKINSSGVLGWIDVKEVFQGYDDVGLKIRKDNFENIIVAGLSRSRVYSDDIVVLKYDSAGSLIWEKRIETQKNYSYLEQLTIDSDDNIYVCGATIDGLKTNYLLSKLDSTGNTVFQENISSAFNTIFSSYACTTDDAKNIFLLCSTEDSTNSNNLVVLKYDSVGNKLWEKIISDSAKSNDNECLIVTKHSIFYCAYSVLNQLANQKDIGVAKFDSSGNVLWKNNFNSIGSQLDLEIKMQVDDEENIIVTGISGSINREMLVLKYDSSGSLLWSTVLTNLNNGSNIPADMALDEAGNIYITGRSDSTGGSRCLTLRINTDGSVAWMHTFNAPLTNFPAMGTAITAGDGYLFVTGSCIDTAFVENILVLVYDTWGNEIYVDTYPSTGPINSCEGADIVYGGHGSFYLTGQTDSFEHAIDYVTMKYSNPTLDVKKFDSKRAPLKIFPNPAQARYTLMYSSDKNTKALIEIFNSTGSTSFKQEVFLKPGANIFDLDSRSMMPGNYILTIRSNNKILGEGRLIKIK